MVALHTEAEMTWKAFRTNYLRKTL